MNEQDSAYDEGRKTANSNRDTEASEIVDGIETAKPATEQQLKDVKREMNAFERSTLKWTRTSAAIYAVTALFICLQWSAMRGQLSEMKSGGVDTHNLAVAAGNQATWTANLAAAAGTQAASTKELAAQASVQANASKQLAQNAVDTLRNTQKAFRQEQRAWVGVLGGETVDYSETRPWLVRLEFVNSGRTPARNVKTSRMYRTTYAPIAGPPLEDIKDLEFRPAHSIAPQGKFIQFIGGNLGDVLAQPGALSNQQGTHELIVRYRDIKYRRLFLYYYGIVKYDDVFGGQRETRYCIVLINPDTKELGFCDSFNDMY